MIKPVAGYTVAAWAAVEVASEIAPVFALPSWTTTLVVVTGLACFPAAVYVSWFFDFSDGKLTRTPAANVAHVQPLSVWHWFGLILILAGAAASGFYIFNELRDRLSRQDDGLVQIDIADTLAVAPFRDQSPNRDQAYFAEGLTEELTNLIGRVDGIQVASSSAAFRLSERGADAVAIGRALEVAAVVSGSVRVSGDQLRVRVELIGTDDGRVLWADSFSRTLLDVFVVEEEIARSIANLLQDRYLDQTELRQRSVTASSDAYVLYLRARALVRERTAESIKSARQLFEQSVGLDPEYAVAHVGVAETLWRLSKGGENFGTLDREVAARLARKSLDKAFLISQEIPTAYANLGRVSALEGDHLAAIEHYEKALALNPNDADVYLWRYLSERAELRFLEAFESLEKGLVLDPTSPAFLHNLGFELSLRGEFDGAREYFDRLLELEPENALGHRGLAQAAFREGSLALSLEKWMAALELSPETPLYQDSIVDMLITLKMVDEFRPLAASSGMEVNLKLLEGKHSSVSEEMDLLRAGYPDDPWIAYEAAWYRLLAGDVADGTKIMIEADALFTDADRFAMPACSPGIELAYAYKQVGLDEKTKEYIDRCREGVAQARRGIYRDSSIDYLDARISALTGNYDSAAQWLDSAVDTGWREWWSMDDPLLKSEPEHDGIALPLHRMMEAIEEQRKLARRYLVDHPLPSLE